MIGGGARAIEIAAVTPVIVWYVFGICAYLPGLDAHLRTVLARPFDVSDAARLISDRNALI